MQDQELDMEALIPSAEAARILDVPTSTMNLWLRTGVVQGKQTLTRRRFVTVGELLRVLGDRGFAGSEEERAVRERLAVRQAAMSERS